MVSDRDRYFKKLEQAQSFFYAAIDRNVKLQTRLEGLVIADRLICEALGHASGGIERAMGSGLLRTCTELRAEIIRMIIAMEKEDARMKAEREALNASGFYHE